MEFNLAHTINLLNRTPKVLRALLEGLPSEWINSNEGEETWSPYDVMGHLIHGERTDWIPRAKIIMEEGESRAFESFDRFAQFEESAGKSVEELLKVFATLRHKNIEQLLAMNITPSDLNRRGQHPALGVVTLGQLLATWVTHDHSHIVQIARTMARQYQDAVGPWQEYLSVLKK